MEEAEERKQKQKQEKMEEEVNQEQKIYNQLHEMRDEYISEEVKKGNNEAVKKVKNVDMLPPPSKNQV